MKKFYAAEYWSGRNTTTGTPHDRTGRLSTACDLAIFPTKNARDEWVANGKITADMGGNCREPVTAKRARYLARGLTGSEYAEYIEMLGMGMEDAMKTRTDNAKCEACGESLSEAAYEETHTRLDHDFCNYECMGVFYGDEIPEDEDFVKIG